MPKSSVINIRTEPDVKQAIEELYSAFGITVSDAVNIFFKKSLMHNGLPFDMQLPQYNIETISALEEAERVSKETGRKRYSNFSELLSEVREEMEYDV